MIPSNHKLEAMTSARMEDRLAEATQLHLARAARQGLRRAALPQTTPANSFGWLRQLATRLIGAGA